MNFIYHGVPAGFEGSELHPLFVLKDLYPSAYESQIKKYDDHPKRKNLPYKKIPKLNCFRGDVIHCSPIHPNLIFKALKKYFPDGNRSVSFYKIPVSNLTGIELCFFDMNRPEYEFGLENDPESVFELIDINTYKEIKEIPQEAQQFYQEWKDRGERGAPAFGKIPHVFVKGSISVKDLDIIDWRDEI